MVPQSNIYILHYLNWFFTYQLIYFKKTQGTELTFKFLADARFFSVKSHYFSSEKHLAANIYNAYYTYKQPAFFTRVSRFSYTKINFYRFYQSVFLKSLFSRKSIQPFEFSARLLLTTKMVHNQWKSLIKQFFIPKPLHIQTSQFLHYNYQMLKGLSPKFSSSRETSLTFYNYKKPVFKKFYSMRDIFWQLYTRSQRTKRKYAQFMTLTLSKQTGKGKSTYPLFYILRQTGLIFSWFHFQLLLRLNLVLVNGKIPSTDIILNIGDVVECLFGVKFLRYYTRVKQISHKYAHYAKQWAFGQKKTSNALKMKLQLPKYLNLIPCSFTYATRFCSFDYILNLIIVIDLPVTHPFPHPNHHYVKSLFRLSFWRYNA